MLLLMVGGVCGLGGQNVMPSVVLVGREGTGCATNQNHLTEGRIAKETSGRKTTV